MRLAASRLAAAALGLEGGDMNGYTEVVSAADIEALARCMSGHDAMSKELHLLNHGFVDASGSMMMNHGFDLRMLVQSQWQPLAVELVLVGTRSLVLTDAGEYMGATFELKQHPTGRQDVRLQCDDALTVEADRLFWRERPAWTGREARLGSEIPLPDAVPASVIEDDWRLCSACADAFQCAYETEYARCPSCGTLTWRVTPDPHMTG